MKNDKRIINHYLSISNKVLLKNKFIHSFAYLIEIITIFLQIVEIYYYEFNPPNKDNKNYFSPFTSFIFELNKLSESIKSIIYFIFIVIVCINSIILNFIIKPNFYVKIMINLSEIFFYRIFLLLLFNCLFSQKSIFLVINIVATLLYIIILFSNFHINHLCIFIPKITIYPFDAFSMIIDFHFIIIKIFISISRMASNKNISKFCFITSLVFFYVLFFYLSYLLIYKSYYIMNNHSLNKIRYSFIISISIIILFILIIDRENINNTLYIISYINILLICTLFIQYFYDPYKFVKFDRDDNIENIFYYFFIFDRDKNCYFLLEEKLEEHLSKCDKCNLCKKYKLIKEKNINEVCDLYNIIYDCKNPAFSIMNKITRGIKKNGVKGFANNTNILINLIHTFSIAINQKNYNIMLNTELLFDIINSQNESFLEQYNLSISQIKYTNDFFIKAKKILDIIYKIFDEKKLGNKIKLFFELGQELEELKYKNIKSNLNNSNNTTGNIEGLPNCNNLLAICTLFYEELFNETLSSSGIPIRESPNILEDLINNNHRNSRQITLEINVLNLEIKIIRAGGVMNKYENNNFYDYFCPIFKKRQISELRKILFQLNSDDEDSELKNEYNKRKLKKGKDGKKKWFRFCFTIEKKENNEIFYELIKLKLNYLLLNNIKNKIYLNGTYTLDDNIIISEQVKTEEIVLYFGNKEQKNYINKTHKEYDNKKILVKNYQNHKYLGKKALKEIYNYLGCKKYRIYYFSLSNKVKINEEVNKTKSMINDHFEEEENNEISNNKVFIINDLASQASSTTSSISTNNSISYNRGSKKIQKNINIIKELNFLKYILFISFFIFLIVLIVESINLKNAYQSIYNNHHFYILYQDYSNTFYTLFFSVISLTCLSKTPQTNECRHYVEEISDNILYKYFQKAVNNNMTEENIKSNFIDIKKLVFYQSQILAEKLNHVNNDMIYFLSKIDSKQLEVALSTNLIHCKINENSIDNETINFSLGTDIITFNDLNLLMVSRFSILTNNINNFKEPIYILNKTGKEVFNNLYNKKKLSSYQENIYLLILDYTTYAANIYNIVYKIIDLVYNSKKRVKSLIYIFISINLFIFLVMNAILILYLLLYYIIILRDLKNIHNDLKEKIRDSTLKDFLRNKMDNLRLLLNIYENNITTIVDNINDIYSDYKEDHKQKVKEESKLLKKEMKFESEIKNNKKINYIKLIKAIKKYELIKYSQRQNLYLYTLLFIVLLYFSVFIINLLLWIFFAIKDAKVSDWNTISENVNGSTHNLMNNYLIMIYGNITLEEFSNGMGFDFISLIYEKITQLYELKKYQKYLKNLLKTTEITMIYECSRFYENLDNDIFKQLKDKYKEEENLLYTMRFFCEYSNLMMYNNFKTIYLQLFNIIKIDMESFSNNKYSDIIEFFDKKNVIENQIMFLIIYVYLMDIMSQNVQTSLILITEQFHSNMIISMILYLIALIIIIIIIYIVYIQNINNDCKKFARIKKVFKICKIDE